MKCLYVLAITMLFSCSTPLEKKVSEKTLPEALVVINNTDSLAAGKKKFINEMFSMSAGMMALAPSSEGVTYIELFETYSHQYDSTKEIFNQRMLNNKRLSELIKLISVEDFSVNKYKGSLALRLLLNNQFGKDILYLIVEYKLVDEYDTEYFKDQAKLTDKLIKNDTLEAYIRHEYDDVSNYLFTKAPSNNEKRKAIFDKGFSITALGVVFKDKSEVTFQSEDWVYF